MFIGLLALASQISADRQPFPLAERCRLSKVGHGPRYSVGGNASTKPQREITATPIGDRMSIKRAAIATATLFAIGLFGPQVLAAGAEGGSSIDAAMAAFLGPISEALSSFVFYKITIAGTKVGWVVLWLGAALIYLTFYFGFINLKPASFRQALKIVRGRYLDPTAPGEVSQLQAMSTALSGTVGIGNIAGVGVAIAWGGPGATFWLILIGLGAMSVKFAECTLGVKYREVHADGSVSGGPMYYLKHGLANRGYAKLGIVLSASYAAFGMPTILQWATVNQMFAQVKNTAGIETGWIFGLVLAALTAIVIIGGIKSIARVTVLLVPLMAGIYLLAALTIILFNFTEIPGAIMTIITGAFAPDAVEGGLIGVIFIGMRRAIYSTEAGLGTSSMAHAAAKTREPVSEGLVGLMEPFIDSVIICTITALVIVISGQYAPQPDGLVGIELTSAAFTSIYPGFDWVLMIAVLLFGFSTIISWGYYNGKIWTFIFGESKASENTFKAVFCLLLIPGGVMTATQVFDIADSLFFMLAVPNIIGLFIMAPELRADLRNYFARINAGEIKEIGETGQAAAAKA